MTKQPKDFASEQLCQALIHGVEAYTSLQAVEEIRHFFYTGQFVGKINPIKVRCQQLVNKKHLSNSYMIGLMYGLLHYWSNFHYQEYVKLVTKLGKTEVDRSKKIQKIVAEISNDYQIQIDLADLWQQYTFDKWPTFSLWRKNNKSLEQLAQQKLEYSRPLSYIECLKGVMNAVKQTQEYYDHLASVIKNNQNNRDPIIVRIGEMSSQLEFKSQTTTVLKELSKKYNWRMKLLKLRAR